ncbi:putative alcohol O-acetyltransferase [Helianthus annuus]|uniref:Alcohol O-acetyltransferase n=1 Tax=Helianthus annuus TaxID=4232 RepID=A0A9K3DX81_HELAN|nr:putative alcohol O-acetyltransferase [Helianthus annuus]KAJ0439732.1 putative alcohol O-acetyltransferase [Helianthus annuus]KAJ0444933.1 putative alcohol O-acetyltransferase [Helianthus annuus]KAJ0462132.1 putative alcohol O-acetyltransferase [Helianthus annuus]KAJ0642517.1 putative alcohol O-acetyltransferase [Helianthus annuus]
MGVLGEFKRGVDVAHGDWFGVREGTHLLGVHPLHPYVMTLPSPTSHNDWVVYMHLPITQMNYIESHAGHMFKPLDSVYLQI